MTRVLCITILATMLFLGKAAAGPSCSNFEEKQVLVEKHGKKSRMIFKRHACMLNGGQPTKFRGIIGCDGWLGGNANY